MIPPNLPPLTDIVCIDAKPRMTPIPLVKGRTYQVRAYSVRFNVVSVLLVGVHAWIHPLNELEEEIGFFRDRFRLPISLKIFTEMLERAPIIKQRQLEDA